LSIVISAVRRSWERNMTKTARAICNQCCGSGSGIRDVRKSASGSGIRDEQPGSYFLELKNHFFAFLWDKILKFFDEDPGSGMETVRIRDPGWKKVGSGIRDKNPGSATLYATLYNW
jgi:hypothetical protein